MKFKKRFMAIVLCAAMILPMGVTAFAAEEGKQSLPDSIEVDEYGMLPMEREKIEASLKSRGKTMADLHFLNNGARSYGVNIKHFLTGHNWDTKYTLSWTIDQGATGTAVGSVDTYVKIEDQDIWGYPAYSDKNITMKVTETYTSAARALYPAQYKMSAHFIYNGEDDYASDWFYLS